MTDIREDGEGLFVGKAQRWVYELHQEVANPANATKALLKKLGVEAKEANIPDLKGLDIDEETLKRIIKKIKDDIAANRLEEIRNSDALEANYLKIIKHNDSIDIDLASDILLELDDKAIEKYSELLSQEELKNAEGVLQFLEDSEVDAIDFPCKFLTRDGLTSYYIYWRLYKAAMEHLGSLEGLGFIEWAITAKKPFRVFLTGTKKTEELKGVIEDNRQLLRASGAFDEYCFGMSWKYTAIQNIVANTCKHIGCEIRIHGHKGADKSKGEDFRQMQKEVYESYYKLKLTRKKTNKTNEQRELVISILESRMREGKKLSDKEERLIRAIGISATIYPTQYIRLKIFQRIINLLETESLKTQLQGKLNEMTAQEKKNDISSMKKSNNDTRKNDVFQVGGVANG